MVKSLVALAACTGLAFAQNQTIEFFWPKGGDYEVPDVSIKSVNASATVFAVACPSPSTYDCDWSLGFNYTIVNSSTYEATMSRDDYMVSRTCQDKGQGGVNCYAEGNDKAHFSSFAANEVWGAITANTFTATVTSGGELLMAASTGSASSSSPSPQAGSSAPSASVSATASTTSQATGAAGKNYVDHSMGLIIVGAGAVALYV
ncbi:hypothetical protein C7974DRAFT_470259 [Boeremia exigua]|uniref:uncharacterized protein n=1 Tax=Boeremia exigua TaxID=749465 RepID=UPI001E8CD224|nr:uncharacterized protein C7974DRAFT_470259 [Boeremia exigua]KAH6639823.1 hypothetical protein C7974DRAFT_470259 [Boeremia exigua]